MSTLINSLHFLYLIRGRIRYSLSVYELRFMFPSLWKYFIWLVFGKEDKGEEIRHMTLDLFLVIITNVISIVLPFSPLPHSHSIFLSLFLSLPLHFHSIFLLSLLLLLLRTNGCCPYFEQIRFLTEVPCSVIVLICISLFSKRKRRRKKEKKILRKKTCLQI